MQLYRDSSIPLIHVGERVSHWFLIEYGVGHDIDGFLNIRRYEE